MTGASRGIGQGIALALAEAGADVALASRTIPALEETASLIRALGRKAAVIPTDVTHVEQVRRMVECTVETLGRIDILVNSAGVSVKKPAVELTEADFDLVYATNIRAVTFACATAGRHFIAQGSGKVINIASLTTALGLPGRSHYGPSKGAVGQLTRTLAAEWGPHGICVNAIAPGWIDTELLRPNWNDPEFRPWALKRTPLGRIGDVDDVAGPAVFLASSAADFVTGQILYVDGGFVIA